MDVMFPVLCLEQLQRAAGEDHLQLFDLTPSSSSSRPNPEPADVSGSRKDHENGLFLSMLLYRVANRLFQENVGMLRHFTAHILLLQS